MNYVSNSVVADGVARILSQDLPWAELNGSTVLISGASGFLPVSGISIRDLATLMASLFPDLGLQVRHEPPPTPPAGYLKSQIARSVPYTSRIAPLGGHASNSVADGFRRTIEAMR